MSTVINTAPIKWAQRSDSLYITIALADVKDEKIELKDTELHFEGNSEGKKYEVNVAFFKAIDATNKDSTYKVLPRSVQMHVMKAKSEDDNEEEEFWPRLLKDKALEKNQVKVDWDRYVDEDEEDEAGGFDTSNLEGGMGGMGGMPGMGGMGGMPGMGGMGGMPGMGGMGGMPGMGGMGGMPGMGGMGGMPGMGGDMGGMDMEALMKQMGDMGNLPGAGGMPGANEEDDDDDDDDDIEDLPELESN